MRPTSRAPTSIWVTGPKCSVLRTVYSRQFCVNTGQLARAMGRTVCRTPGRKWFSPWRPNPYNNNGDNPPTHKRKIRQRPPPYCPAISLPPSSSDRVYRLPLTAKTRSGSMGNTDKSPSQGEIRGVGIHVHRPLIRPQRSGEAVVEAGERLLFRSRRGRSHFAGQNRQCECEKDGCPDTGPPAGTRAGQ